MESLTLPDPRVDADRYRALYCSATGRPMPDDEALLVEGSLSQGLGNSSSDVDFVFVSPVAEDLPALREMLWAGKRRVEVMTRSVGTLRRLIARVHALPYGALTEDQMEDVSAYQRLAHAVVLVDPAGDNPLHDLDASTAAKLLAVHHSETSRALIDASDAAAAVAAWPEAVSSAREAVRAAIKARLATCGESHPNPKWTWQQIIRLAESGEASALVAVYSELAMPATPPTHPADYTTQVRAAVAELLGENLPASVDEIEVRRADGVTAWTAGTQTLLLRDGTGFALSSDAEGPFGELDPAGAVLSVAGSDPLDVRARLVRDLYTGGLVEVRTSGPGWFRTRQESSPVLPGPVMFRIGFVVPEDDDRALWRLPLPAHLSVELLVTISWCMAMVENHWEDIAGALEDGAWGTVEEHVYEMALKFGRILLAAHGVIPLPPLEASIDLLADVPTIDIDLLERLRSLTWGQTATEESSRRALETVVAVQEALPEPLRNDRLIDIYQTENWEAYVALGFAALPLMLELDVPLPHNEVQDLANRIRAAATTQG